MMPPPTAASITKARPASMAITRDINGHDDAEAPEPPAVVGNWTFAMKGMFPPPRPWTGGRKTYASGNETGGGVGYRVV